MKKKRTLAAFFAAALVFTTGLFAQNTGVQDIILLLDTSSSMSASWREVQDWAAGAFLREFLRRGDTFHLIVFSNTPRVDFVRRIEGQGDAETLIGRLFLQYPLDPFSDIQAALAFAESYAATLPARPKRIVLLSDGGASPPAGSPSRALDQAGVENLVNETKARLQKLGAALDYVKVTPGKSLAKLPPPDRTRQEPPESSQPQPPVEPPQQTEPALETAAPALVEKPAPSGEIAPDDEISPNGAISSAAEISGGRQPDSGENGAPAEAVSAAKHAEFPFVLIEVLAAAAIAALALVVFFVSRNLRESPGRVIALAAAPPKEFSGGPVLLNLFVEDQNTFIGKRNIHALKSGCSYTTGGGNSDFLIFLVTIPQAIGKVRRDGNRYTFVPRKYKYFPDIGRHELPDCIGKTIRVISDKNYELRFRFERCDDPLSALVRLFASVKVPG